MMETLALILAFVTSFVAPTSGSGASLQAALYKDAPQNLIMGMRAAVPLTTPTAQPGQKAVPTSTPKRPNPAAMPIPSTAIPRTPRPLAIPRPAATPKAIVVKGKVYDAYLPAATKSKQEFHYSCEFDAAWVVLKTNGFDVSVAEQAAIVGMSKGREPYYKDTAQGIFIYGGDITKEFSGDYKTNFLARSTGQAMRKVFEKYKLRVTVVNTREGMEAALLRGELVWIKTTVDFKPWRDATWVMPDGRTHKTVLGNDHAAVVMGFNKDVVVMRDVLGPTSTGRNRVYEYEVPWPKFMAAWGAQSFDGLAVGK